MKLRSGKQAPPPTKIPSQDSRGRKRKSIIDVTNNNVVVTPSKITKFKQFDISDDPSDHHYLKKTKIQSNTTTKKIMKEWKILETHLPDSIFVRVYEGNINLLQAVIIGPPGTPYHDGLFFFDFNFPPQYPQVPPQVYYHPRGLRLNPNLYDSGYVCLSLLNTWLGQTTEKWIPNKSTILQVLVSIQGLVLNSEPFYNEPFFNGFKGNSIFKSQSNAYTNNAFLLSCKTMVYLLKNPPKNFEGFVVDHFLERRKTILGACKAYYKGEVKVGLFGMHGRGGSNSSCSMKRGFKKSLNQVKSQLLQEFTKIGIDLDMDGVEDEDIDDVDDNCGLGILEGIKKKIVQGLTKLLHACFS